MSRVFKFALRVTRVRAKAYVKFAVVTLQMPAAPMSVPWHCWPEWPGHHFFL